MNDPAKRDHLKRELKELLTPRITRRLPLSMQFPADHGSISKWISDRDAEAQILCVQTRDAATLVGLVILTEDPESTATPTIHLGYFLGENYWGKGFATEFVTELVAVLERNPPMRLIAGVDRSNPASARVLEKSGFRSLAERSTAGREFFEFTTS